MNAPTTLPHLLPEVHQRAVPAALIDALQARCRAHVHDVVMHQQVTPFDERQTHLSIEVGVL